MIQYSERYKMIFAETTIHVFLLQNSVSTPWMLAQWTSPTQRPTKDVATKSTNVFEKNTMKAINTKATNRSSYQVRQRLGYRALGLQPWSWPHCLRKHHEGHHKQPSFKLKVAILYSRFFFSFYRIKDLLLTIQKTIFHIAEKNQVVILESL